MLFVFFLVEAGHRLVELRPIGIIFNAAFKKIFAERKIFTLCLDAQRKARLGLIVHRGHACVPSHVPCRHVPEQNRARLQRCDLSEQ